MTFHVGDFVIGKENNAYNWTNNTALMIVTEERCPEIKVLIVAGRQAVGRSYVVDPSGFDPITPEVYFVLHPDAEKAANYDEICDMYPREIHRGDFITGTSDNPYGVTTTEALCLVERAVIDGDEVGGGDDIYVRVIACKIGSDINSRYCVNSRYFHIVDPNNWDYDHPSSITCKEFEALIGNTTNASNSDEEMVNLMDASLDYEISQEQEDRMIREWAEFLEAYNYPTGKGLVKLFHHCLGYWDFDGKHHPGNKSWICALFSNHPNWNPETLRIEFPKQNWKRGIEKDLILRFIDWAKSNLFELLKGEEEKVEDKDYSEWEQHIYSLERTMYAACEIERYNGEGSILINGLNYTQIRKKAEKANEIFNEAKAKYRVFRDKFFNEVAFEKYDKSINMITLLYDVIEKAVDEAAYADKKTAKRINELFPELSVHEGQKLTKIYKRWAKLAGLDTIREMRPVTHNGVTVEKNYGWDWHYTAELCDGLSPLCYERNTFISCNPLDFWSMSLGTNWASCHTIDLEGKYHGGFGHSYHGAYSSGTQSYMQDKASFILFTEPENKKCFPNNYDKERRCMFFIGEDKLIQSRVYPDGRDCFDASIVKQFRNIAQKAIADCLGCPNMWKLKTGSNACDAVTISNGTHYRDYVEYDDGSVSYLKHDGDWINRHPIEIGENPICPNCGDVHSDTECIICSDCKLLDEHFCERCGDRINLDNAIMDQDTGDYYCSEYCANRSDVYYCNNVEEWHSEDIYIDDCLNEYFYSPFGEHIVTEDGRCFMDEYNANECEYYCVDGRWYHIDDLAYCEKCSEWVLKDDYDDEHECCKSCAEEMKEESEVA